MVFPMAYVKKVDRQQIELLDEYIKKSGFPTNGMIL